MYGQESKLDEWSFNAVKRPPPCFRSRSQFHTLSKAGVLVVSLNTRKVVSKELITVCHACVEDSSWRNPADSRTYTIGDQLQDYILRDAFF